jgi:hypothetical protein
MESRTTRKIMVIKRLTRRMTNSMMKIQTTKITTLGTEGVQILPIVIINQEMMTNTEVEEGVLPEGTMRGCSRMRTLKKTKTLSLLISTLSSQTSR